MRKIWLYTVVVVALCVMLLPLAAFAQANRVASADITCPVAGGASTQLLAARAGRYSYAINNTSGIDIRFVGLAGTATTTLTSANSFLLKAGQPYTDSAPGLYTGRVVCQSTTAATATVSVIETYK